MNRSCCLAFNLVFLFQMYAVGQTASSLHVIDLEGHNTTITADQLSKLEHVTVSTHDHDADVQFEGVPLSAILTNAGVHLGSALRGPRLADVLVVNAADGYRVVFALAELDPDFAAREIILADKRDGKPLDAKEGPYRIVTPGDKRGARCARQVVELKVINVK